MPSFSRLVLGPMLVAGLSAAALGAFVGGWLAGLNQAPLASGDALVLALLMTVFYGVPLVVPPGTLVAIAAYAACRVCAIPAEHDRRLALALQCGSCVGVVAALARVYELGSMRGNLEQAAPGRAELIGFLATGIGSGAAAAMLAWWLLGRVSPRRPLMLGLAVVLLTGCALAGSARGHRSESAPAGPALDAPPRLPLEASATLPPGRKLLLIGFDGLDSDTLETLARQGAVPNFKSFLDEGVVAEVQTLVPTYSPSIWTTLATGMLPERHGIFEFVTYVLPGVARPVHRFPHHTGVIRVLHFLRNIGLARQQPVSSSQRQAKAIWNVLSERGGSVGIVNWWASWPAEAVRGVLVSDRYHYWAQQPRSVGQAREFIYPAALHQQLSELVVPQSEIPAGDLRALFGATVAGAAAPTPASGAWLRKEKLMLQALAGDRSHARIAEHFLQRSSFDLFAVYFRGIDVFSHFVGSRSGLVTRPQDSATPTRYVNALERYYREADEYVGRLLARVGEQTNVVICSDHGFQWEGDEYGHRQAPSALFILRGPDAAASARVRHAHVKDVAPTLLYLLGQPISRDLDGTLLREVIRPATLHERPPQYVASYGPRDASPLAGSSEVDAEMNEALRALGYIN